MSARQDFLGRFFFFLILSTDGWKLFADSKPLSESNIYAIVSSLYLTLLKITVFLHIITTLTAERQCVVPKTTLGWEKNK